MTAQEVKDYITAQLQVPVNEIDNVINSLFKLVDFVGESTVEDIIPDWLAALTFNTDGSGDGKYCKYPDDNGKKRIFETKTSGNTGSGHAPPTDPGITENTYWREISQSGGSAIKEWTSGLYGSGLILVYHEHSNAAIGKQIFMLTEPGRPFNSTNIETEWAAGKWEILGKAYVDAINDGLTWKYYAHAATTANITLSGAQTIDGIALVNGNICLVKDQTDLKENGWYQVKTGAWARVSWASQSYQHNGAIGYVAQGTVNAKTIWKQVTFGVTLGTSNIVFENLSSAATDTAKGVVELATSAETITGTDATRAVTPQGLQAKLDDTIKNVEITVSSADILALWTAPKILVAAPGAGKIIEIISARLKYVPGTAYTGLTDFGISLYNTSIERFLTNRFDFSTSPPAFTVYAQFTKDARTWIASVTENTAICLMQNTANPSGGTGTIKVFLTYRIVTV